MRSPSTLIFPLTHTPTMSSPIICFRTITRAGLFRQAVVEGNKVLLPIALATPPTSVNINPNASIQKIPETSCDGRQVTSLSYESGAEPDLDISFGLAVASLESIIHGRIVESRPTIEGMVFAEFLPNGRTVIPARTTGQVGFGVIAQVPATTRAKAYFIDPSTKLPVDIEIVAATPTGNQMMIGGAMLFTLSPELSAANNEIYVWCPCPFTGATAISAKPLGLITCFFQGVSFNNTARLVIARNCTRAGGGSLSSDPKRDLKLSILPDAGDSTGLGYQIIDVDLQAVC